MRGDLMGQVPARSAAEMRDLRRDDLISRIGDGDPASSAGTWISIGLIPEEIWDVGAEAFVGDGLEFIAATAAFFVAGV